jgi:hypothetical protein
MRRITVAMSLGIVALFAFGFAAIREGTEVWAKSAFSLCVLILLGASVVAVTRRSRSGALPGFVIFGWGYLLLALQILPAAPLLPTTWVIEHWAFRLSKNYVPPPGPPPAPLLPPPTPDIGIPPPPPPDISIPGQAKYFEEVQKSAGQPDDAMSKWQNAYQQHNIDSFNYQRNRDRYNEATANSVVICHSLFSQILGLVGALLGWVVSPRGATRDP